MEADSTSHDKTVREVIKLSCLRKIGAYVAIMDVIILFYYFYSGRELQLQVQFMWRSFFQVLYFDVENLPGVIRELFRLGDVSTMFIFVISVYFCN